MEPSVDREVFEAAFYAVADGIVITDADFSGGGPHILYANPAFTKITGYELHEVVGKNPNFLQGRKTDRRVLKKLKDDLLSGNHFFGQAWNYKKNGTPFLMQWSIAGVKNSQGTVKYYVAIQRESSEREAIIE
ncbi:PAS domain-containing protein [Roseobacter sp. HKCCD7870]|uniref:PAS domain-containing protein n=1 Tax=Roseobacter sp. HKCCD7870 TaxID=3120343 RepID=UPI0030EEDE02